jgi:hypothetical protein
MHSIRAFFGLLMGLLLLSALTACGNSEQEQGNPMSNPAIEAMADKVLETIKAGDYDALVNLYGENFYKTKAPEQWTEELKGFIAERGPIQSFSLRKSQADTRFSGKFYILEYNSVHDGNKRLHHLITIVSPVEGGEPHIVGHKITPWEAKGE